MRRKHCRVPKGRPDGLPCSSPESSATSANLDRRIDGKLQVEDKASRFKSYHAADKCYKRWRALRTSPDGRAELLEFFVFSVCYECYAHSLRALLAVRTPLFRFGLPAQAGLWRACIPVREGTSLRCAQRHRGDCLGGGGIDAARRRQAQGAGGPLPLVGPAPTVDVLPDSGSGGQVTRSGCQLVPDFPSLSAFESEQANYNLIGSCKFAPTRP